MSYEAGVGIAFVLWAAHALNLLVRVNSRLEKNLNKAGLRLSWITLAPKRMSGPKSGAGWAIGKFLLIGLLGLPLIFLSWLYVGLCVVTFLYRLSKDAGAPQRIKEYRWAMKNQDLNVDQIAREILKISDDPDATFESIRSELRANTSWSA